MDRGLRRGQFFDARVVHSGLSLREFCHVLAKESILGINKYTSSKMTLGMLRMRMTNSPWRMNQALLSSFDSADQLT